jgi:hypothetical protein
MELIYKGNVGFEETENSGDMSVDLWGADVLTREWEGSKVLLQTFLASFKITIAGFFQNGQPVVVDRSRQIQDKQLRDMYLTELSISPGRAFAKVRGTFKGVTNGRKPLPVVHYGTKAQQVTLPFIGDELGVTNGISTSFQYQAPYTQFLYLSKRKPRGPLFRGRTEFVENALQISARTGAAGNIKYFRGKTLTSNFSNVSSTGISGGLNCYNAVVECLNQEFDVKPIGTWWEVTETNQILLTPVDLSNSGWSYQLGG